MAPEAGHTASAATTTIARPSRRMTLILIFTSLRLNGLLPRLYTVTRAPARDGRWDFGELCPILGGKRGRPCPRPAIFGFPGEESKAITVLMPVVLPRISSAACSGG